MLKRIITAVIGIAFLIPVLIYSKTILFPIVLSAMTVIALYEIFKCVGVEKQYFMVIPLCLLGGVSPVLLRYVVKTESIADVYLKLIITVVLFLLLVMVFSKNEYDYRDISIAFFSFVYITTAFTGLVYLCDNCIENMYLLVLIGAWVTDIFALFTGKFFGKHKLIPIISPNKTIEGSIGGIVFCSLSFVLFGKFMGYNISVPALIILGVICSIVSQIGDLAMSAVKRKYGIKDFGNIFPGHGGMLDRMDSVMSVSVVLTLVYGYLEFFGA